MYEGPLVPGPRAQQTGGFWVVALREGQRGLDEGQLRILCAERRDGAEEMSGKSKKVNPRRQPATKADVERAKRSAVAKAIRQTQAIVFSALTDKEGWDAEQLLKLWREVNDLSDSIAQGYVNIPDLIDTLRQEYGVDLRE